MHFDLLDSPWQMKLRAPSLMPGGKEGSPLLMRASVLVLLWSCGEQGGSHTVQGGQRELMYRIHHSLSSEYG